MKRLKMIRIIPLLLSLLMVVMMAAPTMSMAAQSTVDLGTTSSFAVLAGSTITNTGPTTINGDAGGDVGLSPGTAFTGQADATISGTVHLADAAAILAKDDLVTAYNDAAERTPVTTIPTELGGTTLIPGTYDSADGTFQITGTLTLDAQGDPDGVFVFKTASTLITAADSSISIINSARYCRTFWKVGSSATLGTNSHFVGHIFAMESITANNGATVQGQLLARTGAVTLENNTITNGICAAPPAPPASATLYVIKHVVNDDGGTAVAANFNLHVKASGVDVTASPAIGVEFPGTIYTLVAGTYVVSEDAVAGYTGSFSGDSTDGNIILTPGDNKTITITNNDGQSTVIYPPLINVIKIPEPLALTSGQGLVTYTYKVTNPGLVALSNVSVTDDKVSPVNYVSGDVNADNLLQPNETWIYSSHVNLAATTTNTVTAKGSANDMTATDIAIATVVVTPLTVDTPPVPGRGTITGGQLPKTSTPWYNLLVGGVALTLTGSMGWWITRKIHE